jgi:hypothetical protein
VSKRGRPSKLIQFDSHAEARSWHEEHGGYLLWLGRGRYGCTDSYSVVAKLRGRKWARWCDVIECWDEVEQAERGYDPPG